MPVGDPPVRRSIVSVVLLGTLSATTVLAPSPGSAGSLAQASAAVDVIPGIVIAFQSSDWRYIEIPYGEVSGFEQPLFDDSSWQVGQAGFGTTNGVCSWNNDADVHTTWNGSDDLLVRKRFSLGSDRSGLQIKGTVDNHSDIYVNGTLIASGQGGFCSSNGIDNAIPEQLLTEKNVLAIRARDDGSASYLDVELSDTTPQPTPGRPDCGQPNTDPVYCYAPRVHMHPKETAFPTSPLKFVENSSLKWAADSSCRDIKIARQGQIDLKMLRSGSYRHREVENGARCFSTGRRYSSNDVTRPYDGNARRNPKLAPAEGFFFDVKKSLLNGDPVPEDDQIRTPVSYRYVKGKFVTYWFFYANNPAADAKARAIDNHEGDWEHLRVNLNRSNYAVSVTYGQHNCKDKVSTYAFDSGMLHMAVGKHLDVYSARGSHASFTKPDSIGKEGVCHGSLGVNQGWGDETKKGGSTWDTWNVPLQDVTLTPWWDFGGAWGKIGTPKIPLLGQQIARSVAPAGPKYKD